MYIKKNFFLTFFDVCFPRYCGARHFFSKKQSVTFAIGNFPHHATYRLKALEVYISDMYNFMGQKPFNFNIKSLIIFAIFPKNTPKLTFAWILPNNFFWIYNLYMYQSIRLSLYSKKTFFGVFWCLIYEILPFQTFFFQKILICNFCYRQLSVSCDIAFESSWRVHFQHIYFYDWKRFISFI